MICRDLGVVEVPAALAPVVALAVACLLLAPDDLPARFQPSSPASSSAIRAAAIGLSRVALHKKIRQYGLTGADPGRV